MWRSERVALESIRASTPPVFMLNSVQRGLSNCTKGGANQLGLAGVKCSEEPHPRPS